LKLEVSNRLIITNIYSKHSLLRILTSKKTLKMSTFTSRRLHNKFDQLQRDLNLSQVISTPQRITSRQMPKLERKARLARHVSPYSTVVRRLALDEDTETTDEDVNEDEDESENVRRRPSVVDFSSDEE
jgi:hypothetical protein